MSNYNEQQLQKENKTYQLYIDKQRARKAELERQALIKQITETSKKDLQTDIKDYLSEKLSTLSKDKTSEIQQIEKELNDLTYLLGNRVYDGMKGKTADAISTKLGNYQVKDLEISAAYIKSDF
ncbi:MAG: hypothetical protein LBM27_00450 [Lactobacillaceae bacterium]|jgi:hypothetical protein|nr:hypothetical protein [Lactobacillaceae bacterium]